MANMIEGKLIGTGLRFGIVCTRWNDFMGHRMLEGAKDALLRHDVADADITIAIVPGCLEIPLAAKKMAESGKYDALVCLGVLIRGGTIHFEQTGIPTAFVVITTETIEQAIERSGCKAGNKGEEAALAAIEMANLLKNL